MLEVAKIALRDPINTHFYAPACAFIEKSFQPRFENSREAKLEHNRIL
jgi:hypothetical protein